MSWLEKEFGMDFYVQEILIEGESPEENQRSLYGIIGVRGSNLPKIDKTKDIISLRKLIFTNAPDLKNNLTDEVLTTHQITGKIDSETINI